MEHTGPRLEVVVAELGASVVERVFVHIGQPKTGTTYLQGVLWRHRDELREQGLLLPGSGHREHLWAALDLQERPRLARRHADAPGSWERLCTEIDAWEGPDALLTHEFFCGASAAQAAAAIARLHPAQVHLLVTARDALGLLTAGWQEQVKNGGTATPEELAAREDDSEFGWRTWDLAGVLERWTPDLDPERVHVVTMPPPGQPHEALWQSFASVLGLVGEYDVADEVVNQSLGLAQVEALRRINRHLDGFRGPTSRGVWIRGTLAEQHLAAQAGDRFALGEDLIAQCRRRSERAVALIDSRHFDVVGDLDALLVPADLPPRRTLDSVTEEEIHEATDLLVASLLAQVRELSNRVREAEEAAVAVPEPTRPRRGRDWIRRLLLREGARPADGVN